MIKQELTSPIEQVICPDISFLAVDLNRDDGSRRNKLQATSRQFPSEKGTQSYSVCSPALAMNFPRGRSGVTDTAINQTWEKVNQHLPEGCASFIDVSDETRGRFGFDGILWLAVSPGSKERPTPDLIRGIYNLALNSENL